MVGAPATGNKAAGLGHASPGSTFGMLRRCLPSVPFRRRIRAAAKVGTVILDIRTTIMIAAALALMVGVSLRYALRDYPASLWPSIRLWILGTVLQPTAWVMYGMRDEIPDVLSMVVANSLLSFAFAKQIQAVRTFVGRPVNPALTYLPVAVTALLEILFTYGTPSMRWRTVTVSAVFCLQMICAVVALLDWSQPRRRSHLLTASAFLALAGVLIVRLVYEGLRVGTLASAFAPTPMQAAVFALAAFFPTVATLGFVLMCSDRLYQELERQATIDSLTGISNRRTLDELSTRAIAAAHRHKRSLGLLLLDADHFKRINDVYGHEVGDEALQMIAATLQFALREEDLVGRLGGEEFVVVLPDADEAAARAGAERLRHAIETAEFSAQHRPIPLRVSIGVAVIDDGDDFASLLRRADQAMYAAKRAGRNRVVGPAELGIRPVVVEANFAG
jgi:diguanylate cyclase (GGDEF)-like protein